jgi:hypothetical protein
MGGLSLSGAVLILLGLLFCVRLFAYSPVRTDSFSCWLHWIIVSRPPPCLFYLVAWFVFVCNWAGLAFWLARERRLV